MIGLLCWLLRGRARCCRPGLPLLLFSASIHPRFATLALAERQACPTGQDCPPLTTWRCMACCRCQAQPHHHIPCCISMLLCRAEPEAALLCPLLPICHPCLPIHVGGLPSPGVGPVGDGVGLREARLAALLVEVGVRRIADAELITCMLSLMSASQSQRKPANYTGLPCKRPSPTCQPSAKQPETQPIDHTGWKAAICPLQAYYTTSQGPSTSTDGGHKEKIAV